MSDRNQNIRVKTLGVIASILAVGAGMQPAPNTAKDMGASTGRQVIAARANQQARPVTNAPSGNAANIQLRALLGGEPLAQYHGIGCPPKIWGESMQCKKMRRNNVRKGYVARYRPQPAA